MSMAPVSRLTRRSARAIAVALHLLIGLFIVHGPFRWWQRLPREHADRKRNAVVRWWARRLCRLLRLQPRVRGAPAAGPVLYVANHVSWLDISCLLASIDATFVAKSEVAGWPLVGDLAAQVGTIFFPRGDGQAQAAAERMMWHLAQRRSVAFFPEGTTSDGTGVRHFHSRLFQAATRTGTAVQPIAVRYTDGTGISRVAPFIGDDDLLRHIWRLLGEKRIDVHLHFCAPCLPGSDRRALARQARARVCAALTVEPDERISLARA